ncbi:MAG: hypothetical protein WC505_04500 [Patescibacteria group bacterium]
MRLSREAKFIILIILIYFFLSWILTWTYFATHLKHIPDGWEAWHEQIMAGDHPDSNQFRIVTPLLAEAVSTAFVQPIFASYLIIRFFFTFLIFCTFHLFLLKWFDHRTALLSGVLLAAITPVTYLPMLQESDVALQFAFLVGLWFIREKKLVPLAILFAAAAFVKETIVFLVPFYLLIHWKRGAEVRALIETAALCIVWGAAFYVSRTMIFDGQNSPLWQLPHNIMVAKQYFTYNPLVNAYLLWVPLFGVFWALPFVRYREKPFFFQRAAIFIVIFTVLHFLFGWPEETRIMLPLAFLVIPAGLMTLFSLEGKP